MLIDYALLFFSVKFFFLNKNRDMIIDFRLKYIILFFNSVFVGGMEKNSDFRIIRLHVKEIIENLSNLVFLRNINVQVKLILRQNY